MSALQSSTPRWGEAPHRVWTPHSLGLSSFIRRELIHDHGVRTPRSGRILRAQTRVGVSSRPHFWNLGVPLRGKGTPFPGGGRPPAPCWPKNPGSSRHSPRKPFSARRPRMERVSATVRAHQVATSSSRALLTRNRPPPTARVGGSGCISRWRPPKPEVALGDLLGARFSPRGRACHMPGAAWAAEIWGGPHGHDTGRGHGAKREASIVGSQPG